VTRPPAPTTLVHHLFKLIKAICDRGVHDPLEYNDTLALRHLEPVIKEALSAWELEKLPEKFYNVSSDNIPGIACGNAGRHDNRPATLVSDPLESGKE